MPQAGQVMEYFFYNTNGERECDIGIQIQVLRARRDKALDKVRALT